MEKINLLESKIFRIVILSIAGLIVLAFVFSMGVYVGTKRAEFSFKWADEYHRNFGGPQGGVFGEFAGMNNGLPNANGSFGQIIKIDTTTGTLTIKDVNNVEKNILVTDKTTIIYQRKNIKISELKLDEDVIAIGDPNDSGQIQAKLIRVFPVKPISTIVNY